MTETYRPRVTGLTVRRWSSERSSVVSIAIWARCRAARAILVMTSFRLGPTATGGAFDSESSGRVPVRLDSARHVRELTDRDLVLSRLAELADEVRVDTGFGITALPARTKSPNCKAGDGTAELRQVLSSEFSLPEPSFGC